VDHQLPNSELRRLNVEVHMPNYSFFATDHGRQVTNRQYKFRSRWLRSLQVK